MQSPHWSEVGRNLFNLVRDLGLFTLIIALLFFPAPIIAQLKAAGVTELSAFGMNAEFEAKFEETAKQTQNALEQSQAAKAELRRTGAALQNATAQIEAIQISNPEVAPQAAAISASLDDSSAKIERAEREIAGTVAKQEQVVTSQQTILENIRAARNSQMKIPSRF